VITTAWIHAFYYNVHNSTDPWRLLQWLQQHGSMYFTIMSTRALIPEDYYSVQNSTDPWRLVQWPQQHGSILLYCPQQHGTLNIITVSTTVWIAEIHYSVTTARIPDDYYSVHNSTNPLSLLHCPKKFTTGFYIEQCKSISHYEYIYFTLINYISSWIRVFSEKVSRMSLNFHCDSIQ
jgi:hypothetical protein